MLEESQPIQVEREIHISVAIVHKAGCVRVCVMGLN